MVVIPLGQVAQAVVNFCVLVIAARELRPDDFAMLSITWMVYVTLLNTQRLIVFEQTLVAAQCGTLRGSAPAIMHPAGWTAAVLFALAGAGILAPSASTETLWVASIGAMLLINDAGRYACMSTGALGRLIAADISIAGAALCGMLVSFAAPEWATWVPLAPVIVAVFLSMLILNAWRVGSWKAAIEFIRSARSFAAWSAVQILGINTLAQFVVLLSLPFVSTSAFAGLRALQALLSPISTPATAIQPAAILAMSKRELRNTRVRRLLALWGVVVTLIAAAFAAALAASAPSWISVLGGSYGEATELVFPIALSFGMIYIGFPFGVISRIARLAKESAVAQLVSVSMGALAMMLLSMYWGIQGSAWAVFLQAALSTLLATRFVFRHLVTRPKWGRYEHWSFLGGRLRDTHSADHNGFRR
jgi:O-antigen/teichoic acid export membrane protein